MKKILPFWTIVVIFTTLSFQIIAYSLVFSFVFYKIKTATNASTASLVVEDGVEEISSTSSTVVTESSGSKSHWMLRRPVRLRTEQPVQSYREISVGSDASLSMHAETGLNSVTGDLFPEGCSGETFYTIPDCDPEVRNRKPMVMHLISDVLPMLKNPDFYNEFAVGGVRPEVRAATAILLREFEKIPVEQRLTPQQVCAIMLRESAHWSEPIHWSCTRPSDLDKLMVVDLNKYGDRKYSPENRAYGPLQLRGEAFNEVFRDKDGQMPFSDEVRQQLRDLGIRATDFHGNILLSYLTLEFWLHRYAPESNLYTKAGTYNAGPTGFRKGNGRSYARAVNQYLGSIEILDTRRANATILASMLDVDKQ